MDPLKLPLTPLFYHSHVRIPEHYKFNLSIFISFSISISPSTNLYQTTIISFPGLGNGLLTGCHSLWLSVFHFSILQPQWSFQKPKLIISCIIPLTCPLYPKLFGWLPTVQKTQTLFFMWTPRPVWGSFLPPQLISWHFTFPVCDSLLLVGISLPSHWPCSMSAQAFGI